MILLIHKDEVVMEVVDLETNQSIENRIKNPIKALFDIAKKKQESILVWCHQSQKDNLNIEGIKTSFQFKNMMLSFSENDYLQEHIGYVEDSPFLKVNKSVRYPTWLMSSNIGAIYASQLLKFENQIRLNETFSFVLNSIAKLGMPNGLFCYSEPKLLNKMTHNKSASKASNFKLFKFVKQHYKGVWSLLLFINFIIYDRKFPVISFMRTLLIKKNMFSSSFDLELVQKKTIKKEATIDVIIPTLGRKQFLKDVLLDLKIQTVLPKQIIIVEQNEDKNSKTELDFIYNTEWPFKIIHKFIHQTGACNARNLALAHVSADYVYLADDDNKFDKELIKNILNTMQYYDFGVITMSYLQKNEVEKEERPLQWSAFGGGSSVIHSKFLDRVAFNMAYEFGYGEDADFGMQLRNLGADVIYTPNIKILHLKAPIGGFRTKFKFPWENDTLQPKPSPTVFFNRKKNTTLKQLLGYKTTLFIQFYKSQDIKNPYTYFKSFKRRWDLSEFWANQLRIKTK